MQYSEQNDDFDDRAQTEFGLSVGVFGFFAFSLLLLVGPVIGS